jgi:hypothetical protein
MYSYRIELRAVHSRTTVATGRGNVRSKRKEVDTAVISHYVYGQTSIEHATATLIRDLPKIRHQAGVSLTPKDVALGLTTKTFRFERISH